VVGTGVHPDSSAQPPSSAMLTMTRAMVTERFMR
jgi:hypothetical protein